MVWFLVLVWEKNQTDFCRMRKQYISYRHFFPLFNMKRNYFAICQGSRWCYFILMEYEEYCREWPSATIPHSLSEREVNHGTVEVQFFWNVLVICEHQFSSHMVSKRNDNLSFYPNMSFCLNLMWLTTCVQLSLNCSNYGALMVRNQYVYQIGSSGSSEFKSAYVYQIDWIITIFNIFYAFFLFLG